MAIKVNSAGVSNASNLIKTGKVDKTSSWSFTAEDGNAILGEDDWAVYSKWFLAIDDAESKETKAYYKFPFGKNGKVYRSGVIAAKQRAAQEKYTDIETAADNLLKEIDKPKKDAANLEMYQRSSSITTNVIDEKNMTVPLSFSSEEPVYRWFGYEYLLHDNNAVNLQPVRDAGSILKNHDPDEIIAKPIEVWVDEQAKVGRAIIQFDKTIQGSRDAFNLVRSGLLRGTSVFYSIDEFREITEEDVKNGYRMPGRIITKWSVREITLTPIPADSTVGVGRQEDIMAIKGNDENINKEAITKEAIEVERKRIADITALARDFDVDATPYIADGKSVNEVREAILNKISSGKKIVSSVKTGKAEVEKVADAMVDAILLRSGIDVDKPAPGAENFRGMTLMEMAKESLKQSSQSTVGSMMEVAGRALGMFRDGITTSIADFPNILANVTNKVLQKAYLETPVKYTPLVFETTANNFQPINVVRTGSFPILSKVPENAEYNYVKIGDEGEVYQVFKYGNKFTISREALINDNVNALSRIPRQMGIAAKRTVEVSVFNLLNNNGVMSDGNAVFSSAHKNIGTAGVISETTLNEMKKLLAEQTDVNGNVIDIAPSYLVVPPAISTTAAKWMRSEYQPGAANETANIFANSMGVIDTARISSVGGGSDTAWYAIASPSQISCIEVAYLNGQRNPYLEKKIGFDVDGVEYKVRLEFGAAITDWRGLFKNAGV